MNINKIIFSCVKGEDSILNLGGYVMLAQKYRIRADIGYKILLGYQTNTDAFILVYKLAQRELVSICNAQYTRPQLTFLALVPWAGLSVMVKFMYNVHKLVLAGLVYTPAHGIWIYGKVLAVWIFVHGQYSSLGKQKLRNYNPNYFGELCIIHC